MRTESCRRTRVRPSLAGRVSTVTTLLRRTIKCPSRYQSKDESVSKSSVRRKDIRIAYDKTGTTTERPNGRFITKPWANVRRTSDYRFCPEIIIVYYISWFYGNLILCKNILHKRNSDWDVRVCVVYYGHVHFGGDTFQCWNLPAVCHNHSKSQNREKYRPVKLTM